MDKQKLEFENIRLLNYQAKVILQIFFMLFLTLIFIAIIVWLCQPITFSGNLIVNNVNATGNFSFPWILLIGA